MEGFNGNDGQSLLVEQSDREKLQRYRMRPVTGISNMVLDFRLVVISFAMKMNVTDTHNDNDIVNLCQILLHPSVHARRPLCRKFTSPQVFLNASSQQPKGIRKVTAGLGGHSSWSRILSKLHILNSLKL
ncbi:hypothetical protein CEXT_202991 [Caerostris extrusa]|uniref:Uncharacterized protein n=1 Tax=Caerostris extrusa TaxID=172846 RepID=A0AAV4PYP7_CAEEX|nr:hypothetical protein CEXT_202991 [Caerostris extrusa]